MSDTGWWFQAILKMLANPPSQTLGENKERLKPPTIRLNDSFEAHPGRSRRYKTTNLCLSSSSTSPCTSCGRRAAAHLIQGHTQLMQQMAGSERQSKYPEDQSFSSLSRSKTTVARGRNRQANRKGLVAHIGGLLRHDHYHPLPNVWRFLGETLVREFAPRIRNQIMHLWASNVMDYHGLPSSAPWLISQSIKLLVARNSSNHQQWPSTNITAELACHRGSIDDGQGKWSIMLTTKQVPSWLTIIIPYN